MKGNSKIRLSGMCRTVCDGEVFAFHMQTEQLQSRSSPGDRSTISVRGPFKHRSEFRACLSFARSLSAVRACCRISEALGRRRRRVARWRRISLRVRDRHLLALASFARLRMEKQKFPRPCRVGSIDFRWLAGCMTRVAGVKLTVVTCAVPTLRSVAADCPPGLSLCSPTLLNVLQHHLLSHPLLSLSVRPSLCGPAGLLTIQ